MFENFILNGKKFFEKLSKNKHFKYGGPFFIFTAVALTVLSNTATVRYDFRKGKTLDKEELKSLGFKVREKSQTLEEIYEEYKKIDLDNWENIRGPRLWDETPPSSS